MKSAIPRNPGLRLAVALTALWLGVWLLPVSVTQTVGPLGLPWLTWAHIVLGLAAVISTAWAAIAVTKWEDEQSRHSN